MERTRRWPPRQRIRLTEDGAAALAAYVRLVADGRGRGDAAHTLQEAMDAWAGALGVRAADGMVLEELARSSPTVSELMRALEACGLSLGDVKAAIDRLYGAGLVQPPEKPSLPESPPRSY